MLSKVRKNISELGLFTTILYLADQMLRKLADSSGVYFYYFYEQPLEEQKTAPQRRKVFDFYWITEADDNILKTPRPKSVILNRFSDESQCIVARKDSSDDFLGCAWFAFRQYQEDEVNCIYDFSGSPEKVWDYDVYISPQYRMSRLFLRLWQNASDSLYKRGYHSSLSRISAYNRQSINSHEKFGAQQRGWAVFFKISKAQIMISNKQPFISLSFGLRGQPTLTF